ncbi:ASCH domain-containing protein [Amycolatopsis suaedae]|uniref:ASCH domain-containing protein n=1 Tax=Amycolatopsis suaedae TaxID=2510978 RepID=A0A4Q7J9A8_9PSEU|nr:ASCH domain-containing protein [Amycolatopsis suaedae]RZQ63472.1 ASCH domain-containing protein [Amycolatopsis suaedae]
MRKAEFGSPGPLRDQLVAAILAGTKVTTTGLLAEYEQAGEPLPEPGERWLLVDSDDVTIGMIEILEVTCLRLADVDLRHAVDEGEGYTTVAQWRSAHEQFWNGGDMDDDTMVVAERFRLVDKI